MKKLFSIIIAAVLVASLAAVSAFAGFYSASGGCTTEIEIKKADPSAVKKDGMIGEGEYAQLDVNYDPLTTDLVISYEQDEVYLLAEDFLDNVKFYMSWDEVHGLNVGVVATLLETPKNTSFQPGNDYYGAGLDFPGDEFLFQFGMMFRVSNADGETILNRGISKNTETGELLYGHYGEHGLTGVLNQTAGTDYTVAINGNTVTYEISFPMASIVEADKLNGASPVDGTALYFSVTATGGSKGMLNLGADDERNTSGEDTACYCVSLGDYGYMTNDRGFEERSSAIGLFSDETITTGGGEVDPPVENPPAENPPAENPPAENPPAENPPAENPPAENPPAENPPAENPPAENPPAENPNGGNNTPSAPQTADVAVIAAVVSAVSAAGYAISRKRR